MVKGAQREVSYRHKECACDFLQEELREAHLHRRIVTIAYQQKDAKEAKEDRHADDQASQEGGEFSIHCIGYLSLCRQEAFEPRVFRACHGFALCAIGHRLTTMG